MAAIDRQQDDLPGEPDPDLAMGAVRLAEDLLRAARRDMTRQERRDAERLQRLMADPVAKTLIFSLADQVFRPPTHRRAAERFRDLLKDHGLPVGLSMSERVALKTAAAASHTAPELVMPSITRRLRGETESVILPGEESLLRRHLIRRKTEGYRMNLNQLGEAVLGEREAERRLQANIDRLRSPDCEYLSVKLSSIFSQINLVAFEESVAGIKQRLRRLYQAAIESPGGPKFVNLDMEEYRDLHLTCAVFREVLDEPEFLQLEAGIVLQAYLPDAWPLQRELNAWARDRVDRGGAGIKLRIVKGANLAMEQVDAEIHGWPLATYGSKHEVDANFKRMIHEGCRHADVVRLGVASHNLFDVAYALLLRERLGVADRVEFEMLEGMANHQARSVRGSAGELLLYAPVVNASDLHNASASVLRRLDENTAPQNYLHDLFGMRPGDAAWERQKQRFLEAVDARDTVRAGPARRQNRTRTVVIAAPAEETFHNEPDTDWSLLDNVTWIREIILRAADRTVECLPLQIDGEWISPATEAIGRDPSRPGETAYRHGMAGDVEIERALSAAVAAQGAWHDAGREERARRLRSCADALAAARGELIAAIVSDAGKAVAEADTEVSEAIDFARYYARPPDAEGFEDGSRALPLGTVVVTPPWNFPLAIPCGGICAALAAGNTVILKPAPEAVWVAWNLVNTLWRGGIPHQVLQFVPCPDNAIGRRLVTDARVDGVILTGARETALRFQEWRPNVRLFAETSGKNALVITAAADPDLAIKDLVRSAFGHSGQKCSAASLALVEGSLHDSPSFLRQLRDAAASLPVGSAWDFQSVVTPLIREPGEALHRALTVLDPGESWLLEPRVDPANPHLWSPGIKLGVTAQSWFRHTECFGPVLGLVRVENLDEAILTQNDSSFALTAGLHSLDEKEVARWQEQVEAGNAYVNRGITGAIVQRQPFGGWKQSVFGPGAKAGGPNYVAQFAHWHDSGDPASQAPPLPPEEKLLDRMRAVSPCDFPRLVAAAGSDAWWWREVFAVDHDPSGLACESNLLRYRPFDRAILRAEDGLSDGDILRWLLAGSCAGVAMEISLSASRPLIEAFADVATIRVESPTEIRERFPDSRAGSVVVRAPIDDGPLGLAAARSGTRIVHGPILLNGRLELLPFLREQSITQTLHRYGNTLRQPRAGAG